MSTPGNALAIRAKTVEETLMDNSSIQRFRDGIGELERWLTAEKLARVALTAVLQNADLLECDPRTILAATLQLGQVGLLPDGFLGQAYLIPFNNTVQLANGQRGKQMQATALIGFRGFGELIARSGKANSHDAQVVYANDEFDFAMGSEPYLRHVRKLGNRGEVIGAYCVVYMKEGPARFDIMDLDELHKIRNNSRGAGRSDSPWNTWTAEMYRKSPVRRLAKYVPLSPEFQKAATIDEGSELGYSKFDDKSGAYIIGERSDKDDKPPVHPAQRVSTVHSGPVCGKCGEPVKVEGDAVIHLNKHDYDHKAVLPAAEPAVESKNETPQQVTEQPQGATEQPQQAAEQPQSAPEQGQKELTYDASQSQEGPDSYDKTSNPNGKHISVAQHSRMWAIVHAGQERAKQAGNKPLSDEEFLEYVKGKIGVADARFCPKDKALYEEICSYGGGESIKVSNGGTK